MINRQAYNKTLLALLSQAIEDYPNLRFSQLLANLDYVKTIAIKEDLYNVDEYYLESDKLLERVTLALSKLPVKSTT